MSSDPNCIFCKIVAGELPSTIHYSDDLVLAFEDIHPIAATHLLVIPKDHVTFLTGLDASNEELLGHMMLVASALAKDRNIDSSGYRLSINQGPNAGQDVDHLHMHLMGGEPLGLSASPG